MSWLFDPAIKHSTLTNSWGWDNCWQDEETYFYICHVPHDLRIRCMIAYSPPKQHMPGVHINQISREHVARDFYRPTLDELDQAYEQIIADPLPWMVEMLL